MNWIIERAMAWVVANKEQAIKMLVEYLMKYLDPLSVAKYLVIGLREVAKGLKVLAERTQTPVDDQVAKAFSDAIEAIAKMLKVP